MSPSVEPFIESKYKALMDGLECSEIQKSKLERTLRFDSEFYSKAALTITNTVSHMKHIPLTEYVTISDGNHASISDRFLAEGVPYYRGQDAGSFFIEDSTPICIDHCTFDLPIMRRSHLRKNDVLLSIVGTIGAVSLVYSSRDATCSCKLAILRPKKENMAAILAVLLSSKYGQSQIKRYTRGAIQKGLILEDMDQLVIPCFENGFNSVIRTVVNLAYSCRINSVKTYEQASYLLQERLQINSLQVLNKTISEKNYLNSYKLTGRLDAEYYQQKYDTLFDVLSKFKTKKLGGINGIVDIMKSIEPGSEAYVDEGIPFVRVSDVSKFEISIPDIKLNANIVSNPQQLFPKKDTIIFSKDGSVGIAYKIPDDMQIITSGALLHLTVRNTAEVLPDYLTLVLNSPVVRLQAERDASGAIIQHWKPSEIENVIIPILDMGTQQKIADIIQESFALRQKSKQLLEYAKQAVEMAIEQGEEIALEWLKGKVDE